MILHPESKTAGVLTAIRPTSHTMREKCKRVEKGRISSIFPGCGAAEGSNSLIHSNEYNLKTAGEGMQVWNAVNEWGVL